MAQKLPTPGSTINKLKLALNQPVSQPFQPAARNVVDIANKLFNSPLNLPQTVSNIGKNLGKQYAYDPDTKRVLPAAAIYPENQLFNPQTGKLNPNMVVAVGSMVGAVTPIGKFPSGLPDVNPIKSNAPPEQVVYRAVDSVGRGSTIGKGSYFTLNPDNAVKYGKNIKAFTLNPDAKMLNLTDADELQRFTDDAIRANRDLWAKVYLKDGADEALGQVMTKAAKDLGYDGILSNDKAFGSVVFDSKLLKPALIGNPQLQQIRQGRADKTPEQIVAEQKAYSEALDKMKKGTFTAPQSPLEAEKLKAMQGNTTQSSLLYDSKPDKFTAIENHIKSVGKVSSPNTAVDANFITRDGSFVSVDTGHTKALGNLGMGEKGLDDYLNAGGIRTYISRENGDINIQMNKAPTPQQIQVLENLPADRRYFFDIRAVHPNYSKVGITKSDFLDTLNKAFSDKRIKEGIQLSPGMTNILGRIGL